MTVIYANHGDTDTSLLPLIWEGFNDANVVELQANLIYRVDRDYETRVNEAIAAEDDTLIICGHGTEYGLLHPDIWRGEYLIHENNYQLIHARNVICVWCHASEFAERVGMNGFFTSMFISNINEAQVYNFYDTSSRAIIDSNIRFYRNINSLLTQHTPLNEWVEHLTANSVPEDSVEAYNNNGLRYFDNNQAQVL